MIVYIWFECNDEIVYDYDMAKCNMCELFILAYYDIYYSLLYYVKLIWWMINLINDIIWYIMICLFILILMISEW